MSDNALEKDDMQNENKDNLSENNMDAMEEELARELNVDDSVSGMQHLDDGLEDEGETEKLKEELAEAKDKYVRLVAEFDNFRKRNAKERIELMQTAGKDVIKSLLDVLDDSVRAQKQMETTGDIEQIKQGITLVFNKLHNAMQQNGLQVMDCKGQEFNADLHEAITEIPAPTPDMEGKVIDVVEQGYYLNDKLIRHAKVVVGK